MKLLCWAVAVIALAVPASAAASSPAPTLPAPTYPSTVSKEVLVKADDGVELAGTLTFPSADGKTVAPGKFPVVLSLTPYGRDGECSCPDPAMFATRGIAAADFDVRGTGGSGGNLKENYFSPREARDGAEVVQWLGRQPWSTGKVGMAGGSYVGITQYLTAEQEPSHLAAIVPDVALGDLYRDAFTHGGIINLFFDLQYIGVQGAPGLLTPNRDPALLQATLAAKLGQITQSPPGLIALDYLARPFDDHFYRVRSPIYNARRIQVPVLDIGEWHDGLLRGEPEMYGALSKRRGVATKLWMDPCTHKGCGPPFAPFTNPPNVESEAALTFEFLNHHLTGAKAPKRPNVTYYVQNSGRYFHAKTWPPPGTRYRKLALGDGTLGGHAATGTASYVSDPAAGFSNAFAQYGTVAITPYLPLDQRLEGPHGLTFRTAPAKTPERLVGPMALHLDAASSATDTDWYVRLADVAPDGTETPITDGALRASLRALDRRKSTPIQPYQKLTHPQPLEPNRFYRYAIEIPSTAWQLQPGHRLQLRLTSSDLPTHLPGSVRVDTNDLTKTQVALNPPATNTVKLGSSYLLAPLAPAGGSG